MLKSFSATSRLLCLWAVSALLFANTINAQEANEKGSVYYKRGLSIGSDDGNYSLTINGRVQTRSEYQYRKAAKNSHNSEFSLPVARLNFKGHAIDPRFTYGIQLAFDNAQPRLQDFFTNFAVLPADIQLKVGRFLHGYSWLELPSSGGLEFVDRSNTYRDFRLGYATGLSFHNGKLGRFNWDVGLYENGTVPNANATQAALSGSFSYNHNKIDASSEADLDGGPFRLIATIGGFARSNVRERTISGYAGSLGALAKCYNGALSLGGFLGTPEVSGEITKEQLKFGGLAQASYVFAKRYGVAARYSLGGDLLKPKLGQRKPLTHEILAGGSLYLYGHDLKVQLDGGLEIVGDRYDPTVRAQLQFAF